MSPVQTRTRPPGRWLAAVAAAMAPLLPPAAAAQQVEAGSRRATLLIGSRRWTKCHPAPGLLSGSRGPGAVRPGPSQSKHFLFPVGRQARRAPGRGLRRAAPLWLHPPEADPGLSLLRRSLRLPDLGQTAPSACRGRPWPSPRGAAGSEPPSASRWAPAGPGPSPDPWPLRTPTKTTIKASLFVTRWNLHPHPTVPLPRHRPRWCPSRGTGSAVAPA